MKFYKLDEVPIWRDDQVFKVSPVGKGIAMLILVGIAVVSLVAAISGWRPMNMSTTAYYYFAIIFGLCGLIPLGMFRASLKPSAWLARCNSSGIIIKYRAYENWKLPADTVQAVGFEYGEIAWVKLVKERRNSPSSDGGTETTFLTYIDLGLVNPDTSDLEKHLQAEMNLQPDGRMVFLDYPVQVLPDGIVEIRWTGGIRPRARKAIGIFHRLGINVVEVERRKTDLTHHRNSNLDEERAKIVLLAKSGDKLGAVKLARQTYGYSLTQAHEFVEKLTSGE